MEAGYREERLSCWHWKNSKDTIFESQKISSCIVYTLVSVLPGASGSKGSNLVLTMVGENEHDCLRENNVIYYSEVKSHLGSEDTVYY